MNIIPFLYSGKRPDYSIEREGTFSITPIGYDKAKDSYGFTVKIEEDGKAPRYEVAYYNPNVPDWNTRRFLTFMKDRPEGATYRLINHNLKLTKSMVAVLTESLKEYYTFSEEKVLLDELTPKGKRRFETRLKMVPK